MLVHRSKVASGDRIFALQTLRNQIGAHVYPVHRLDKGTSGVLLFALYPESAKALSSLFAERKIVKRYAAVVRGWTDSEGRIDYALKEILDKTTDGKARIDKPAKSALSDYQTMAQTEIDQAVGRYDTARYSFLHVYPKTGRKHQIRRHFKHIFHPILGDRKYGDRAHNAHLRDGMHCSRMLLAATLLQFEHPFSSETMRVEAPHDFPESIMDYFKEPLSICKDR